METDNTAVTAHANITTRTVTNVTTTLTTMRPDNVTTTHNNFSMGTPTNVVITTPSNVTVPPGVNHVTGTSDIVTTATASAPDNVTRGATGMTGDDDLVTGKGLLTISIILLCTSHLPVYRV